MADDPKDERIRALEEEIRRLQQMLESAPDFITRVTLDGRFLYVNAVAPGLRVEDVVGSPTDNYTQPEYHEAMRVARQTAVETRKTQQFASMGHISADRIGHYLTRISPVIENEKVTSLVMIATNVTELEENRTNLKLALQATGLGLWHYEPANGRGYWDETTLRIFGLESPGPPIDLERMMSNHIHPEDRALVQSSLERAMTTGTYGPIEHRIVRPDGQTRWIAASGVALRDIDPMRVVGTIRDVTDRTVLEARLLEVHKLESLGRLAGGIAHDFNNLITAILASVELANRAKSLDEVKPRLSEVRLTAERSAALTAQLLTFARRQQIAPRELSPSLVVKRVEPLLRRLLGDQIELELCLDASGQVRADESQIEQVLINLITNARDSMPDGGRVLLSTKDVVTAASERRHAPDLVPGVYTMISVKDEGVGISAEARANIFEPFFTTRERGTGLGLSTCYGIAKQSGGAITVESELGRGATFSLYLPRVDQSRTASLAPAGPVGGGERVLLVEDEAAVRAVVERMLRLAHYQVTSAGSAEEALQIADSVPPFDVMITDVVMPGMHGWELGRTLAARFPNLRILYISGYSDRWGQPTAPGDRKLPFLQKPFLPADLLTVVRKLLDENEELA